MQRQLRSKEELLAPQQIPADFEGGVIVKARLERDGDGVSVKPDLSMQKRWW
jgi:hypothetical protein